MSRPFVIFPLAPFESFFGSLARHFRCCFPRLFFRLRFATCFPRPSTGMKRSNRLPLHPHPTTTTHKDEYPPRTHRDGRPESTSAGCTPSHISPPFVSLFFSFPVQECFPFSFFSLSVYARLFSFASNEKRRTVASLPPIYGPVFLFPSMVGLLRGKLLPSFRTPSTYGTLFSKLPAIFLPSFLGFALTLGSP